MSDNLHGECVHKHEDAATEGTEISHVEHHLQLRAAAAEISREKELRAKAEDVLAWIASDQCAAAPEGDGTRDRCLDPEYVDVSHDPDWPANPEAVAARLKRCDSCHAAAYFAALASIEEPTT